MILDVFTFRNQKQVLFQNINNRYLICTFSKYLSEVGNHSLTTWNVYEFRTSVDFTLCRIRGREYVRDIWSSYSLIPCLWLINFISYSHVWILFEINETLNTIGQSLVHYGKIVCFCGQYWATKAYYFSMMDEAVFVLPLFPVSCQNLSVLYWKWKTVDLKNVRNFRNSKHRQLHQQPHTRAKTLP